MWKIQLNSYQYDQYIGNQRQATLERYLPTLVHTYNCTKNNATDFSPSYLMNGHKPRLPIDIQFSLTSPQSEKHSHNKFLAKFSAQLYWSYGLADQHKCKESTHQKWQFDWKMRASRLEPSNICLVWQKAFGGKHKIGDYLENTEYVVV